MSTGAAEAGVCQGAVWAWKNQERVSLGLTTFLPTMGSHPGPPLHLGSHEDNDRRTGPCPPPLNSGKRLGQHRGLSDKDLPAGTAHPPSLVGTCGKMCGRDSIRMAMPDRQHKAQSPNNSLAKQTVRHIHLFFLPFLFLDRVSLHTPG